MRKDLKSDKVAYKFIKDHEAAIAKDQKIMKKQKKIKKIKAMRITFSKRK